MRNRRTTCKSYDVKSSTAHPAQNINILWLVSVSNFRSPDVSKLAHAIKIQSYCMNGITYLSCFAQENGCQLPNLHRTERGVLLYLSLCALPVHSW